MLLVELSAHDFLSRNKPKHTQLAIIRRFCGNLSNISLPFMIFRRLNAVFIALCVRNMEHAISSVETRPDARKSQSFYDFFSNFCDISLPFEIFASFTRSCYFILHAKRSVRVFQRRKKIKHTQIAIIRRFVDN